MPSSRSCCFSSTLFLIHLERSSSPMVGTELVTDCFLFRGSSPFPFLGGTTACTLSDVSVTRLIWEFLFCCAVLPRRPCWSSGGASTKDFLWRSTSDIQSSVEARFVLPSATRLVVEASPLPVPGSQPTRTSPDLYSLLSLRTAGALEAPGSQSRTLGLVSLAFVSSASSPSAPPAALLPDARSEFSPVEEASRSSDVPVDGLMIILRLRASRAESARPKLSGKAC
mmetsp:Transcript_671/g.2560  ORF Transcript_671/g.2560 Transcript_671/m.2560 type:complete len:226 (-) Transcript_671:704-1381(-)